MGESIQSQLCAHGYDRFATYMDHEAAAEKIASPLLLLTNPAKLQLLDIHLNEIRATIDPDDAPRLIAKAMEWHDRQGE